MTDSRDHVSFLPEGIEDPDSPHSGWDRVRELYRRNDHGDYPEETRFLAKSALTGFIFGMVYGGVPAARLGREQFIKQSQAEVYRHRVEAVRSAHNAAIRGFIRYGFRWGWRVAAFVTVFNGVTSGISAYRDKAAISHFGVAGAVTGGLFRLNLGLRGLVGGSFVGAVLGIPVGAVISGVQALTGEDLYEQKRKHRREVYESKLKQWGSQLQLTDVMVEEMTEADREPATKELERITRMLELPRNPGPTSED